MILKMNMLLFLVLLVSLDLGLAALQDNALYVEINSQCEPKKSQATSSNKASTELVVDSMAMMIIEKDTRKIRYTGKQATGQENGHPNHWQVQIEDPSVETLLGSNEGSNLDVVAIVYVRRQKGLKGDNPIYYGYNKDNIKWPQSANDNTSDGQEFGVENAININRLGLRFKKVDDSSRSAKNAFDCNDPNAWIANHGIYEISKDGVRNLYYDPLRSTKNHRVEYLT